MESGVQGAPGKFFVDRRERVIMDSNFDDYKAK